MTHTTPGFGFIHLAAPSLAGDGTPVPRYRVAAACLTLKSETGHIQHAYAGATLDWLHPQQRFLLESGEVVAIDAPQLAPEPESGDGGHPVVACGAALAELGVHPSCGAPAARNALRNGGYRFGNEVIAAAVKARKSETDRDELSRTAATAV